jgi:hypothetical protein
VIILPCVVPVDSDAEHRRPHPHRPARA